MSAMGVVKVDPVQVLNSDCLGAILSYLDPASVRTAALIRESPGLKLRHLTLGTQNISLVFVGAIQRLEDDEFRWGEIRQPSRSPW